MNLSKDFSSIQSLYFLDNSQVPDELSRLSNLEHLQMSRNALTSVHGELSDLPRLRSVIVRHNQVSYYCSVVLRFEELK